MKRQTLIRVATEADDEAIGSLLVQSFVEQYAKKMPEVILTAERKDELRKVAQKRQLAHVWVAELGGKIVGTVALWAPNAEGSEAFLPNSADLRHLAVHASMRGKGVSGALLDAAEEKARSLRCVNVCLHVRRGALSVARIYAGRGYERDPKGDMDLLPAVFLEAYFKRL